MREENIRKIQSFVRRSGRLTTSQQNGLTKLWHNYGVELPKGLLELKQIFGNNNPIILEIGFGNGNSLLEMAQKNPDINYLGLEVYEAGVGRIISQAFNLGLNNIKIIKEDALELLTNNLHDKCLSGVQLFFPDPWHKKKHHKRRIVQPDFLSSLSKKLIKKGFLHIATDWEDYAQHINLCLNTHKAFKNNEYGTTSTTRPLHRPMTKFERRGLRLGHNIWDFYAINH